MSTILVAVIMLMMISLATIANAGDANAACNSGQSSLRKLKQISKNLRATKSSTLSAFDAERKRSNFVAVANGITTEEYDLNNSAAQDECESTSKDMSNIFKREHIDISQGDTLEVVSKSYSGDSDDGDLSETKVITYGYGQVGDESRRKAIQYMKWQCERQRLVDRNNPGKTAQALYLKSITVDSNGNVHYEIGVLAARCNRDDHAVRFNRNRNAPTINNYAATGYDGVCPVSGWYRGVSNHIGIRTYDPGYSGDDLDSHEIAIRNRHPELWAAHDCLKYENASSLNDSYGRYRSARQCGNSVVNTCNNNYWGSVHRSNDLPYYRNEDGVIRYGRIFSFTKTIKHYANPVDADDLGEHITNIIPSAKLCAWYGYKDSRGRYREFSGNRSNGACNYLSISIKWKVTSKWDMSGESGIKNVGKTIDHNTNQDTRYVHHIKAHPGDNVLWRHALIPLNRQYGATLDRKVSVFPKSGYGLKGRFANENAFNTGIDNIRGTDFNNMQIDGRITDDAFNYGYQNLDDDEDDAERINPDLNGTKGMLIGSNTGFLFDVFCNSEQAFDMKDKYCTDNTAMCSISVMSTSGYGLDRLMRRRIQPNDADNTICRNISWQPPGTDGVSESNLACVWVPYYYPHGGGDDGFDSNNAVGVIPSASADDKTHVGKRLHFSYTVLNKNSGSGNYTQTRNIGYSEYAVVLKGKDISQSTFNETISSNKYDKARVVTPDESGYSDLSAGNAGYFFSRFFGGFKAINIRSVQKINTGSSE